jgi:hypothetical protein
VITVFDLLEEFQQPPLSLQGTDFAIIQKAKTSNDKFNQKISDKLTGQ